MIFSRLKSGLAAKFGLLISLPLLVASLAIVSSMRDATLNVIWLTVGAIFLAILATTILVRSIVRPIKRLATAAKEVSQGNFDHPVEVTSEDEIGLLAASFNNMIADLKRSREGLQYRLEIEELAATISSRFINLAPDEFDSEINNAMQRIGEFVEADYGFISILAGGEEEMIHIYEWNAEETERRGHSLKGIPAEAFSWFEKLSRLEKVQISRETDLPSEASGMMELLGLQDTRSLVVVPMIYGGNCIGILGLSSVSAEKTWIEEDIVPLKMVGEILVNALERKRSEEAFQHQLEVEEHISRELEEKTEELSRSNEELNAFVYTVSHDLKAPLVSLQGFSSLLLRGYKDRLDEDGIMYIDRIHKNSERMATLIDALLELSRIGRIEGQKESVNISEIISDVADELAPQLEERGTRLIVKGEMPVLWCDRTRITQVFANLMSNANKYMGENNRSPTIEVGYDSQNSYHTFYVRDNGIGIHEEYHERIFRIFQRLDNTQAEGTGVGLTIVKKIVENFGGRIWVDSAKGKGTSIYFTVPKEANTERRMIES